MSPRTVDWTALRATTSGASAAEGLRERKKRQMRQQLTDTATEMFVERGFDAVRVAEIAAACGVSEKTVFNYFPTKESLVLDRPDATMAALRTGLADPDSVPIEAALRILADELNAQISWLDAQPDRAEAGAKIRRFNALVQATPTLRAYQRDMTDQLVALTAGLLADRAGRNTDDPEAQIAAIALIGLWHVHFASLRKHLDAVRSSAQVRQAVTDDVGSAARLLRAGLSTFAGGTEELPGR